MKNTLKHSLILSLAAAILFGCSIPKHSYVLIHPAGLEQDERNAVSKGCIKEAQKLSETPLTEKESIRIKNVETGRFFEGGRGHSEFSDRYVLCFLNNNYQLLSPPVNFLPETKCELLSKYKTAGIDKDRLEHLCKSKDKEQCDACK